MFGKFLLLLGLLGSSFAQFDPNCNGKQVIVQMFEWKWKDIALECERYLGANQFCGVQVRKHIAFDTSFGNIFLIDN